MSKLVSAYEGVALAERDAMHEGPDPSAPARAGWDAVEDREVLGARLWG